MNEQTRVKICGVTNLEDALLAAAAGADYLGFVFYQGSQRAVTPEIVRPIVQALRERPGCPVLVGVFVNEPAAAMAAILDACQLDLAQLSGDEPPALIGEPTSPLYGRSYKALRPTSLAEAEAEAEWYRPPAPVPARPALLLDAHRPGSYGGSGQTSDWAIAAQLAAEMPGLVLAGGLTPDNVAEAIRQVRPFGVDVSSGIEASPGRKDPAKVQAFIQAARTA